MQALWKRAEMAFSPHTRINLAVWLEKGTAPFQRRSDTFRQIARDLHAYPNQGFQKAVPPALQRPKSHEETRVRFARLHELQLHIQGIAWEADAAGTTARQRRGIRRAAPCRRHLRERREIGSRQKPTRSLLRSRPLPVTAPARCRSYWVAPVPHRWPPRTTPGQERLG